jgi:hypothetical protein
LCEGLGVPVFDLVNPVVGAYPQPDRDVGEALQRASLVLRTGGREGDPSPELVEAVVAVALAEQTARELDRVTARRLGIGVPTLRRAVHELTDGRFETFYAAREHALGFAVQQRAEQGRPISAARNRGGITAALMRQVAEHLGIDQEGARDAQDG